jgi:hypothetical protein
MGDSCVTVTPSYLLKAGLSLRCSESERSPISGLSSSLLPSFIEINCLFSFFILFGGVFAKKLEG